jgi:hypothetical protein
VDTDGLGLWVHLKFFIGHRLATHIVWVPHHAHNVVHFHAKFQFVDPRRDYYFLIKLDLLFFILTNTAPFELC